MKPYDWIQKKFGTPWTLEPLTDEMKADLRRVSGSDDVAEAAINDYDTAVHRMRGERRKDSRSNKVILSALPLAIIGATLLTVSSLALPGASIYLAATIVALVGGGMNLAASHESGQDLEDSVRIITVIAARRATDLVGDETNLKLKRGLAQALSATASVFGRRYKKKSLGLDGERAGDLLLARRGKQGSRVIESLIARTYATDDFKAMRDDLWRLHLRAIASDFERIKQLRFAPEAPVDQPAGGSLRLSWKKVGVALAAVVTLGAPATELVDWLMRVL